MSEPYPSFRRDFFSLRPMNEQARHAVSHSCNIHLVSLSTVGSPVIGVGFPIGSKTLNLATLGRGEDAVIYIPDARIARI